MPYDVVAANRQAVQTGTALGAQMFNNALRLQEFQSQRAFRQLQEQQAAETLAWTIKQHHDAIQQEADTAKANSVFQSLTTPTLQMPTPLQGPPTAEQGPGPIGDVPVDVPNPAYIPNRGEAYLKAYGPLAKSPDQASKYLLDAATINLHDMQAKRQEALAKEGPFQSGFSVATDPLTGEQHSIFQSSPRSAQLINQPGIRTLVDPDTGEQVKVIQQGNSVKNMPVDIGARQTNQKLLSKMLELDPSKVEVTQGANGEVVAKVSPENWKQVAGQGAITTAMRTVLQKQNLEGMKIISLGQELAPLLTAENVGARGNLLRGYEGIMSQINPSFKISGATDAAALAGEFNASVVKGMKSDSNIAEPERASIETNLPKVDAWRKGAPQARSTLASQLRLWGMISRNNAEMAGKPVTPIWMKPDEIAAALKAKQITPAQADQLMQSNGWRLIDTLRQSALAKP